ncbi:hypothetical protein KSC_037340 [Ktedonobacter sp. SOSP1-52]|uniref:hypothetical protein n=1 Tax=Ktedonobacter sp. SOSP1-52 TaxID=2778366 RepID=UPI0019168EE8|nr:hypothetical protein [Ktedonobacter sp. SOSP1-52]GHO64842.1 hypothetical protein KSC_037340 [Ktedonobacter sp. SOSP1-52]
MPHKDPEKRAQYSKEYGKQWYPKHKDEVIARRKKKQQEITKWFRECKSTFQCMRCGISHPAVLQFHHRDRSSKNFNIARRAINPTSQKKLAEEIAKCDVLCVNCHAKLHWEEKHGGKEAE